MAAANQISLISGSLTANTAGTEAGTYWPGGICELAAQGDFGSGTLKLQWSLDDAGGGTWTDVTGASMTVSGRVRPADDMLGQGLYVRVQLSGATSPSITYKVTRVVAMS